MSVNMINDRIRIGRIIADIRKKRGLTVRELSERCGVTYQNISKIENGRYSVGIDILSKIAAELGYRVELISF